MTSFMAIRDPVADHLLTPQNAALVIIDFQPVQVSSVQSRPKRELVANITALARIGKLYDLPVVLSNVNVKTGRNQPTIHQIVDVLAGVGPIDRTSINAWEDEDFVHAVKTTGRKKACHGRAVDRGLPRAPRAHRHQGRFRGLPGHRLRRCHLDRSA